MLKSLVALAPLAILALSATPAAAAETVFANVTANDGLNFRWLRGSAAGNGANAAFGTTASPTGTALGADALVAFSLSGAPAPLTTSALFSIAGSSTNDAVGVTSGAFTQNLDSFSFTIKAQNAFTYSGIDILAGQTLLSGTVLNGRISGILGGSTGTLAADTALGSTVNFSSSPLFTFQPGTSFGFSFNLTGITPNTGTGFVTASAATALSTFRAQADGSLLSDPAPVFPAAGVIPEPDTWAMMIVGMGLVGLARRRRTAAAAA
jgi:hypothetical protein